jgi:hypothetical protein
MILIFLGLIFDFLKDLEFLHFSRATFLNETDKAFSFLALIIGISFKSLFLVCLNRVLLSLILYLRRMKHPSI